VSGPGQALFVLSAIFALVGAVGVVMPRNPLRSAVGLLVHVVSLAGVYLSLHAHLLAALQLLVYAGAVVVLFVFVIMMIGPDAAPQVRDTHGMLARAVSFGVMVALAGIVAFTLAEVDLGPRPEAEICAPTEGAECGQFGGLKAFGRELYSDVVVPFELVSVLMLVGVVGAVAVARGRTQREMQELAERRRGAAAGKPASGA
jgi:NADH-quinone oxidoreductase subunit J